MDFKRIEFCREMDGFLCESRRIRQEDAGFLSFFEAGARVIRWPFGACMCRFSSAIGGGWRIKMLDEQFSVAIKSSRELIFNSNEQEIPR